MEDHSGLRTVWPAGFMSLANPMESSRPASRPYLSYLLLRHLDHVDDAYEDKGRASSLNVMLG